MAEQTPQPRPRVLLTLAVLTAAVLFGVVPLTRSAGHLDLAVLMDAGAWLAKRV